MTASVLGEGGVRLGADDSVDVDDGDGGAEAFGQFAEHQDIYLIVAGIKQGASVIGRVLPHPRVPDNLVGILGTVLCAQLPEVGALTVVVDRVGQVDSVAH